MQFGSALKYEAVAPRRGGNGRIYAYGVGGGFVNVVEQISKRSPESDGR